MNRRSIVLLALMATLGRESASSGVVEFYPGSGEDLCPGDESWVPADIYIALGQALSASGFMFGGTMVSGPMEIECSMAVLTRTMTGKAAVSAVVVSTGSVSGHDGRKKFFMVAYHLQGRWNYRVVESGDAKPDPSRNDGGTYGWGMGIVRSSREPLPMLVLIRPSSWCMFGQAAEVDLFRLSFESSGRPPITTFECRRVLEVDGIGSCNSVGSGAWEQNDDVLDFRQLGEGGTGEITRWTTTKLGAHGSSDEWTEETSTDFRWDPSRKLFRSRRKDSPAD